MIATTENKHVFTAENVKTKATNQVLCYAHSLIQAARERDIMKEQALVQIRRALKDKDFYLA